MPQENFSSIKRSKQNIFFCLLEIKKNFLKHELDQNSKLLYIGLDCRFGLWSEWSKNWKDYDHAETYHHQNNDYHYEETDYHYKEIDYYDKEADYHYEETDYHYKEIDYYDKEADYHYNEADYDQNYDHHYQDHDYVQE